MHILNYWEDIPTLKQIDLTKSDFSKIYVSQSGENFTCFDKWRLDHLMEDYNNYKLVFAAYCGQFAEYDSFNKLNESNMRVILEHIESIEDEYDDSFDFYNILYIRGYKVLALHKDCAKEDIISIMEMILSTSDYIILDDENFFVCESCQESFDRILDNEDELNLTSTGELCSYCHNEQKTEEA